MLTRDERQLMDEQEGGEKEKKRTREGEKRKKIFTCKKSRL